ncbi:ABC transporter permease [Zavarzinia sp. CC-PAN008]|uniref:ABC transporter permease n=1 Tax=Zavarzinia sp. CC-PAN008 TaxID=3243332 RepID=UPI003F7452F8
MPRTGLLLGALAWLLALFLLLPAFISIPVSLNDSRFVAMPKDGQLSTRHYERMFACETVQGGTADSSLTRCDWLDSIADSAQVAVCATILAVILGTACAIGLWRLGGRVAGWMAAVVLAPAILPSIVSALALSRAWVWLGLSDTFLGVVIAHTIVATPFVVIAVTTALASLDPRLEQASRSLGAGAFGTAWRVIVPNIKPGIATAAVFAFVISWDEIVVTLFVSSRAVYTLPRRMWDGIRENVDPTVTAVATVLIVATAALVIAGVLRGAWSARTSRIAANEET